jgi:DNA-binding NarL/FixJ family response regulator
MQRAAMGAKTRKKILCIENDCETTALIAEELRDRGFEVSIAYNGQDGLLAIPKGQPDLVLCDNSISIMSGFEVLERLTETAPLGHIPFVFLTAPSDRDNDLKGRRLGADDYVTKPIDFDRLALIISTRLAGIVRTNSLPEHLKLNGHEIEILTWVARGQTSAQIASKLRMPKRTVDFHINKAQLKLGADTRTEAAVKAATSGVIKP